jgi:3-phosphoshikimate 1-carboxyvinyltransferase
LILAALADGQTTLRGALWSEDTQVMVDALRQLGFGLRVEPDPAEVCNRTITVTGLGGRLPNAGTADKPLEIFVGNAGTAARFLAALVCLGRGAYRLHGVPRMHERPQAALLAALRELGYQIDSPNDKLPAIIHGTGPRAAGCQVSIEESSQFASALLLCAEAGQWRVEVSGENREEASYVGMTTRLLRAFSRRGGTFEIEADASSGSYFVAAGKLQPSTVHVADWPSSGLQVDERFIDWASRLTEKTTAPRVVSRHLDLGDSIMTLIILAPLASAPWRFTDLGRLRLQESERVAALREELTRCGARVEEEGDTLTVFPSEPHGAEIETYNDHRMAMCFAVLGLKVPGVKIRNPACVKKTFPNFFQKLAAKPPHGLGAIILDARMRQPLEVEELFAD